MFAIISLITVLFVSLLIMRIATLALTFTGLSRQSARFQARSAFTRVGFTTRESEKVVNHPVRRRIIMLLMLLGNAGVVTVISTLVLGFVQQTDEIHLAIKLGVLFAGLAALTAMASSSWVDRRLSRIIHWALVRFTTLEIKDYAALLHLAGEWAISELYVEDSDWLAHRTLQDLQLNTEGVLVLGIERDGGSTFIGAPRGTVEILPDDILLLYGRSASMARLDERASGPGGEREHRRAAAEHDRESEQEAADNDPDREESGPDPEA